MNAQTARDIDYALFSALAPAFPRGFTAEFLFDQRVKDKVDCTIQDVEARLAFFAGLEQIKPIPQDPNLPDLPPYWALTSAGVIEARRRGINTK